MAQIRGANNIVLDELPAWSGRKLELGHRKLEGDDGFEFTHPDGQSLFVLGVEKRTQNVTIEVRSTERLVVSVAGAGASTKKPATRPRSVKCRNWCIENAPEGGRQMRVWLKEGNDVRLPIMPTPGPSTPIDSIEKPIHEVIGQPEMLFALAVGIKERKHVLLEGPTGIAKTTVIRWLCSLLNYDLVIQPIARGTQDRHMTGEYAPAGPGDFKWMDGPVTRAARLSQTRPVILLIDEINRIGNVAEFSRIYQLIDDTRMLELPERRTDLGDVERIVAGDLYVMATSNPSDDDNADYIGVKELDPAFVSRFPIKPPLTYPAPRFEINALMDRVSSLSKDDATRMVKTANAIRGATEVRYPISFRELEIWATLLNYHDWHQAAEIAVVSKASAVYRSDLRNLVALSAK